MQINDVVHTCTVLYCMHCMRAICALCANGPVMRMRHAHMSTQAACMRRLIIATVRSLKYLWFNIDLACACTGYVY